MLLEIWRENPVANSSLQKAFLSIVVSTAYSSSKCLIRGCSLITLYTKVPFLLDWNGVNTKHTNLEIGTFFCCCWLGFFLLSLSRPPLGGCFFVRVGVCARLVGFFVHMSQRNTADLKQMFLLSSWGSFHPYSMPPAEKGLTDVIRKAWVYYRWNP